MSVKIAGGAGGDSGDLRQSGFALWTQLRNSIGAKLGLTQREALTTTSEGIPMMGKNDDIATFIRTDRKGNVMTGNYNPELIEQYEGATVNTSRWSFTTTTFVGAQSTIGGLNFNSTNLTTISSVALSQSTRNFYKLPRMPLQFKQRVRANIQTNSTMDMGFGFAPLSTALIVPNGVCIRCVNGLWSAAMTFNSSEIATTNIVGVDGVTQFSTANVNSDYFVVDGIFDDDNFVVTIQNTQTGAIVGRCSLPVPLSAVKMWGATSLPFYYRVFNSGTPTIAPVFIVSETQILSLDINLGMDASQVSANLGFTADKNPYSGAQLANFTNSVAPSSATLSNTAGGYATTIKDGKWQFAAPAGAATDYVLFSWVIPNGTRFICEGVKIDARNTGATVATTATTLEWGISISSNVTSLAVPFPRITLGHQSFPIGGLAEAITNTIDTNFVTPMVAESGRVINLIVNVPVGTATASQIIRGTYFLKGRFI